MRLLRVRAQRTVNTTSAVRAAVQAAAVPYPALPCAVRTLSALTFLVEQDKKESQREGGGGGGSGLFLFHPLVLSHTNTATAEAAGAGGGGSSATLTRPTSSSSSARPDLWDPDLDSPRGSNNNNSGETLT